MSNARALLTAYNSQLPPFEQFGLPDDAFTEADGRVTRVIFPRWGYVSSPPDIGVFGSDLDVLITRQRDRFASRNADKAEWQTWDTDLPSNLSERLVAAGFMEERRERLLVGTVEKVAERAQREK